MTLVGTLLLFSTLIDTATENITSVYFSKITVQYKNVMYNTI